LTQIKKEVSTKKKKQNEEQMKKKQELEFASEKAFEEIKIMKDRMTKMAG
jgi:hypothetical protein